MEIASASHSSMHAGAGINSARLTANPSTVADTLYVSVPSEGKVYACTEADGSGSYETVTAFIEGRDPNMIPQGIQWHDGDLWLAQLDAVTRHRDTDGDGKPT